MLKVLGNICAVVGVALTGLMGVPVWVAYVGIGLKAAADGLKAAGDLQDKK